MDLANRNEDSAHFDEITESAEAEREMIDSRVADLWKDKATVCRIIVENADDIHSVANDCLVYDQEKAVEQIISDAMRVEIEQDLNI